MKEWLEQVGIDVALMISGMFGSLIMVSHDSARNIKSAVIGIIAGMLSANYLTQIAVDLTGLEGKSEYGLAFLLGYFGLKGVEKMANKYLDK
jgi:hypothetical protein